MPTEKKVQAVEEMTATLSRSSVVIGADYRGLSVAEATDLRRMLRDAGIQIQVIKNTLFLRAAEAAGKPGVGELAEGPTAIIYGFDDPIAPIKTVVDYQRQARNAFQARKAFLDGQVIPANRLSDLASLPPKEVMIAEVAGALQSPITNLVYLLTATLQEFSGLLDARADQMGSEPTTAVAATEPVAAEPAATEEVPAQAAETTAAEAETEQASPEETTQEPEALEEENSTEETGEENAT